MVGCAATTSAVDADDEDDARTRRDDAGGARRPRQEGHLAEDGAAAEACEEQRFARLIAEDLELAAGEHERLCAGRALLDDLLAFPEEADLEGGDEGAEGRRRERREERLRRDGRR